MFTIDSKTKSLKIKLGATPTNELIWSVSYIDTIIPQSKGGETDGTTAVTLVSGIPITQAPPQNTNRRVENISIYNSDVAAQQVTVFILNDAAEEIKISVNLGIGFTLHYNENGWYVTDTTGAILTTVVSVSSLPSLTDKQIWIGDGTNTAVAHAISGDATMTNTGVVTVSNSAVIGKVLTGYASGAGVVAATDTILQAIQKLNGNNGASLTITDDTTTNAKMYPTWVTANSGSLAVKVSSTKMFFNPSTGLLSSTAFSVVGTGGVGYIDLVGQSAAAAAPSAGTLRLYSETTQGFTRLVQDNEATTNLVYGRDSVTIVRNTSGASIPKGSAVYVTGSTGNVPNVSLAKANALTTTQTVYLLVDTIANNAYGQGLCVGVLGSFDTSAFTTGQTLYLSTTVAGELTATRPSGTTNFVKHIGVVLVSAVGNGSINVNIAPAVLNTETGTNAATWTASAVVATTYNGITLSTAAGATFTLAAGTTITAPAATATLATLALAETLTNKTLTVPIISSTVPSTAGSLGYDGKVFYSIPTTGANGVSPSIMYAIVEAGGFVLSTATGVQSAFPTTKDVWTLDANTTYEIDWYFTIIKTGTTCTVAFALALGGGASITSAYLQTISSNGTTGATLQFSTVSLGSQVISATSSVNCIVRIKGLIRMNAGGTITPQVNFSASPTSPSIQGGSYIKFTPLGTDTNNTIGNVA